MDLNLIPLRCRIFQRKAKIVESIERHEKWLAKMERAEAAW